VSPTTQQLMTNCQVTHPGLGRVGPTAALGHMIRLWRSRHRERRTFELLDERDLRDLGTSRWAVERELSRPVWRD
jgi:uncharacterized protein YjiS (DUF1127 family)